MGALTEKALDLGRETSDVALVCFLSQSIRDKKKPVGHILTSTRSVFVGSKSRFGPVGTVRPLIVLYKGTG